MCPKRSGDPCRPTSATWSTCVASDTHVGRDLKPTHWGFSRLIEGQVEAGGGGARRSKSAPHMHVLVCTCSNVEAVLTAVSITALLQAQCVLVHWLAVFWQPLPQLLQCYVQRDLFQSRQISAQGLALSRPDLLVSVEVRSRPVMQ